MTPPRIGSPALGGPDDASQSVTATEHPSAPAAVVEGPGNGANAPGPARTSNARDSFVRHRADLPGGTVPHGRSFWRTVGDRLSAAADSVSGCLPCRSRGRLDPLDDELDPAGPARPVAHPQSPSADPRPGAPGPLTALAPPVRPPEQAGAHQADRPATPVRAPLTPPKAAPGSGYAQGPAADGATDEARISKPAPASNPWYAVFGVEQAWSELHRISRTCVTKPDAQIVLRNQYRSLADEVESQVEASRDERTGDIPPEKARAEMEFKDFCAEVFALLDAFRELGIEGGMLPELSDPLAIARRVVLEEGSDSLQRSLEAFRLHVEARVQKLSTAQSVPAPLEMAHRTCLRLYTQAMVVLKAYADLDLQANWLVPPELDLRCATHGGVEELKRQAEELEAALRVKKYGLANVFDEQYRAGEDAIWVCREWIEEAIAMAEEHREYLERQPPNRNPQEATADRVGLMGFEVETLAVTTTDYLPRGTPMARLDGGWIEADNVLSPDRLASLADFEAVSAPFRNPHEVDRFTQSTRGFFDAMTIHAAETNRSPSLTSIWPAADVVKDVRARPLVAIRNGVMVCSQVTTGVYFLEHLPRVCELAVGPSAQVESDVARLDDVCRRRLGRGLTRKAMGLVYFIVRTLRWADAAPANLETPHVSLSVMSRKSFSSMFRHALKSESNKAAVRELLDGALNRSTDNPGVPLLMTELGIPKDANVFRKGYLLLDAGETKQVVGESPGPSTRDWLTSILYPERFGRPTDFLSPPPGYENQRGKAYGMGNLGEVDAHTGECIVELRARADLPSAYPASALPIVGVIEYAQWSRFNPNLPQLDLSKCDPATREQGMAGFRFLSELYFLLAEFASCAYERKPPSAGLKSLIRSATNRVASEGGVAALLPKGMAVNCFTLRNDVQREDLSGDALTVAGCVAEHICHKLYAALPGILKVLFQNEVEAWEAWRDKHPAGSAATPGASIMA
jgi:hypothetical protein